MKLLPMGPGYFEYDLEVRYRARQNEQALAGTRVLMLMAATALTLFSVWDHFYEPTSLSQTLPIRALGTGIILVLWSGTYHGQLRNQLSWLLFGNTVTCTTIVAWVLVVMAPASGTPAGGTPMVAGLPNFFFVPLSFAFLPNYRAVAVNCIAVMLIVNGVQLADNTDRLAVINTNIFLSAMCAVTGLFAWVNEARNRHMFALEMELERLATTDSLSGAHNRRYFTERAESEIERARRYDHSLSVLLLDIDYFKRINDTHGHRAGDNALRAVAATCRDALRKNDMLGRMGGEEFAILLPETSLADAAQLAERLRISLESMRVDPENAPAAAGKARVESEVKPLSLTASIGVAAWRGSDSFESLLHRADTCLYEAKHQGRNRVVVGDVVERDGVAA